MFEINILNTVLYSVGVLVIFYAFFCIVAKKLLRPDWKKLVYIVFLFSLLGVIGEDFVNTVYYIIVGTPLWEYRLYPTHDENISYFFPLVWGTLGFYTYWRSVVFIRNSHMSTLSIGLLLGTEAIFIELMVNIPYHMLFGNYIFYYLPANLGPLSHFSCLEVVPFYMLVGIASANMLEQQENMHYKHFRTTIFFYLMIMVTVVYL
ncbi:MAG: hypothetical protein WBK95_04570 [Sulfurimonas sp.]|jgi:hypothetical protein|nr:hypothetical protein [Sulfurimonas sp.]MDD3060023.1 hypothetical protein [Sulfurimonas sp.]MDD5202709.1 hypothetical protein [Sulfurimonas sp.]